MTDYKLSDLADVEVRVGRVVEPDRWKVGGTLVACDWDAAPFRLVGHHAYYPVKVAATGRTTQRRQGCLWVRVRITWVHDGAPETFSGGWMKV